MINFAKIVNGKIEFAKNPLWTNEMMISNPTDDHYLSEGYLRVVFNDAPKDENRYYEAKYKKENDTLVQYWVEIHPPQ